MAYIEFKEVMVKQLTCNHPKVKRIWEYGGLSEMPTNSEMVIHVEVLLHDDTRISFKGNAPDDVFSKAEKFISLLPIY